MAFTTASRAHAFQGLGVPFTTSSRDHIFQGLGVPFTGSSRVNRFMAAVYTRRTHLLLSYQEMETGTRAHKFTGYSSFTTGSRSYGFADRAFWTNTRQPHRMGSFRTLTTASRVHKLQADPPPIAASGSDSELFWVISGKSNKPGNYDPTYYPVVSFSGPANIGDLDCDASTVILSSSENTTSSISINVKDQVYKYHPYGSGSRASLMGDGEEIACRVDWGGQERVFNAIMKRPVINRQGSSPPDITWPGIGHSSKLFKSKKTLETLGSIGSPTGQTNWDILAEVCDAVSLYYNWRGIKEIPIGGPYHRQNLLPGAVAKQMLDLTLDNWCDEQDEIVGYNPEIPRATWYYEVGDDVVYRWSITPEDNEVYDKIIVLRAIATGKLQSTGSNTFTEVTDFGEYTVSLGGLSAVTTKVEYADYRGQFSDFRYDTPYGTIIRAPKANWPSSLSGGAIKNATSVTFTWGAKTPEVTAAGVTSGNGAISFYGMPHRAGTTGEGNNALSESDYTTRVTAGSGDNELEFAPTPLLAGAAQMNYLAAKALRRLGKPWIQHVFEMPLNHLIRVGDHINITGDSYLGGGVVGTFEVVSYTHTVSKVPIERKSVVTLRELLS